MVRKIKTIATIKLRPAKRLLRYEPCCPTDFQRNVTSGSIN